MKKRKIIYELEWEWKYDCEVIAKDWYHLKTIIDWLLSYYKWWDIISIERIEDEKNLY